MSLKICAVFLVLLLAINLGADARKNVLETIPHRSDDPLQNHDPIVHDYFQRSIGLVFHEKHEACLQMLKQFSHSYPDHPAPDFLKAACYQSYMNTFRTNRFTAIMDQHVDTAISKGLRLLKHSDDPWLHFYVGASYGFRALNRFRRHAWINALLNMKSSIDHLKTVLAKAPNLYDAYMGIGVYNYWRTARSNFICTVAFWMNDRREIGLQQLQFVLVNGVYAPHETSYNLIATLIDAGRFDSALNLVDQNIARKGIPQIIDLYYKGRILLSMERWEQSEVFHKLLLERLNDSPLAVEGYEAEVGYRIALSLFKQKRYMEALSFTSTAMVHCAHRRPDEEIESSFESFQEIKSRLKQLHQKLNVLHDGSRQDTAKGGR
jgi:tetratricopeptide (TPR) repeat protein